MKRLGFLDSLRGLAAVVVIFYHIPLILTPKLPIPELIKPLWMYGGTGVVLFFIISGFSLTMTMPSHEKSKYPLISYAISRFFRIAPLFYILIAWNIFDTYLKWGVIPSATAIIENLTFTFNLDPGNAWGLVGAGWTVGVEMFFYLLFPIIYYFFTNPLNALALAIASLVGSYIFFHLSAPLFGSPELLFTYHDLSLITHFPTFVFGVAAFGIWSSLSKKHEWQNMGPLLVAIGLFGLAMLVVNKDALPMVWVTQAPAPFFAIALIGFGLWPVRLVVNRTAQFYGKISYSTPPIIFAMEPLLHRIYDFGLGDSISLAVCCASVLMVVTIVAFASSRLIEEPVMQIGRDIKKKMRAERPVPPLTSVPDTQS